MAVLQAYPESRGGPGMFQLAYPMALTSPAADSQSIWNDLMAIQIPAPEKIIRTVAVYLGIVVMIRFAGKRLMAQMNSLDLVVVLLLSNVVQNAIIGEDNSLVGGLLGALVLLGVNAALERITQRFDVVARLLEGSPTTLVTDGVVDDGALERLGMSRLELRTALRQQGADAVGEVEHAEIEPGGNVVVDRKRLEQGVSYGEFRAGLDEMKAYLDSRLTAGRP